MWKWCVRVDNQVKKIIQMRPKRIHWNPNRSWFQTHLIRDLRRKRNVVHENSPTGKGRDWLKVFACDFIENFNEILTWFRQIVNENREQCLSKSCENKFCVQNDNTWRCVHEQHVQLTQDPSTQNVRLDTLLLFKKTEQSKSNFTDITTTSVKNSTVLILSIPSKCVTDFVI